VNQYITVHTSIRISQYTTVCQDNAMYITVSKSQRGDQYKQQIVYFSLP